MATGSCTSTRPGLDRPATTPGCCVLVAAQAKPVDDGAYSASVRDGPANRMSTLGSLSLARARGRAAEVVPLEAVSPSSAHFRFALDGACEETGQKSTSNLAVSLCIRYGIVRLTTQPRRGRKKGGRASAAVIR